MIPTVEAPKDKNVIVADEVRVGPILITKTSDGGAGIWFGRGQGEPMISLFHIKGEHRQTGVGIYADTHQQACNICLGVNPQDGGGEIQFTRKDEVMFLSIDDVKELHAMIAERKK